MTIRTTTAPAPAGPAPTHPGSGSELSLMTPRRIQILALAANGHTNAEIGRELFLSEDTIKTHLRTIYTALGAKDRTHAAALGLTLGFVHPTQVRPRGGA